MIHVIRRTPRLIERLFPSLIWGDEDRVTGPLYLTFDDGPDPKSTPALLECLGKHGIRAIFFLNGDRLLESPEPAKKIHAAGHLLGYHGHTHRAWCCLRRSALLREMDPGSLKSPVAGLLTERENGYLLLRPPYGRFDLATLRTAKLLNAVVIMWRLVLGDWLAGKSADTIKGGLESMVRPGDIVVLHDGGPHGPELPEILDQVIPVWRNRGLRTGDPAELIGRALE